jgi:hypothetical protein
MGWKPLRGHLDVVPVQRIHGLDLHLNKGHTKHAISCHLSDELQTLIDKIKSRNGVKSELGGH